MTSRGSLKLVSLLNLPTNTPFITACPLHRLDELLSTSFQLEISVSHHTICYWAGLRESKPNRNLKFKVIQISTNFKKWIRH